MTLDEWNERYRVREELDREPASLLVGAARGVPPGRALDLACGAGRNAVWLAQNGWNVVAIDGAEEAVRIVRELDPHIDARALDLETDASLPFDDASFDLIAILYFLWQPLFREAHRLLREGGLIVSAVRTHGRFCMSLAELRAQFDGWEILRANDGEIAEIVARKRNYQENNVPV
ncbi:MAG TPA: methyltransferase domain-containing protein [Thermoanaerobaculia bacterium]|nr:methyltransferase domain-containing protein [Thermoanaerobaculia bacterium]